MILTDAFRQESSGGATHSFMSRDTTGGTTGGTGGRLPPLRQERGTDVGREGQAPAVRQTRIERGRQVKRRARSAEKPNEVTL